MERKVKAIFEGLCVCVCGGGGGWGGEDKASGRECIQIPLEDS